MAVVPHRPSGPVLDRQRIAARCAAARREQDGARGPTAHPMPDTSQELAVRVERPDPRKTEIADHVHDDEPEQTLPVTAITTFLPMDDPRTMFQVHPLSEGIDACSASQERSRAILASRRAVQSRRRARAYDDHVAVRTRLSPLLRPEVEHRVQVDVGQERRILPP